MKNLNMALAVFLCATASTAYSVQKTGTLHEKARGGFVPQRVLVKYVNEKAQWDVLQELEAQQMTYRLGAMNRVQKISVTTDLVRFASGVSVKDAVRALRHDPRIEWAQPDYYLSIFSLPTQNSTRDQSLASLNVGFHGMLRTAADRLFVDEEPNQPREETNPPFQAPSDQPREGAGDSLTGELWGMNRIGAGLAWNSQRGSKEIIVADIDTGVDYNHEDLRHNMWSGIGYDFADKDAYPWDTHGHGTHTSGSIGATGGNGVGVSGVVQRTSIMAIRFIGSQGYGTTSDAILSIDYAVHNGARVLSNSWGGAPEEDDSVNIALKESIERAAAADVLFIAAAGNDGSNIDEAPMYPAAYDVPNIISVASTNNKDRRSFFSNFGAKSVDVGAPGSNIMSTVPGNKYMMNSGTSMACPHVAGVAALVLSERPDLSAADVKEIIMSSVDPFPALRGITVTGGLVNAAAALEGARNFGK